MKGVLTLAPDFIQYKKGLLYQVDGIMHCIRVKVDKSGFEIKGV